MLKPKDPSKVLPGPFCSSCAYDSFALKMIRVQGIAELLPAIICAKCGTMVGLHNLKNPTRRMSV